MTPTKMPGTATGRLWGAAAPVGDFGCGVGIGRFLSPSQKSKIFDSPAGPAPLLSALRTFSPLTGKSALVRGGLWVRCEAGGAEVGERFLRCFAATPHPSAALTPSPQGEGKRRCRASATVRRGDAWRRESGRVAERSEYKNNMIAGGNHTIMQR